MQTYACDDCGATVSQETDFWFTDWKCPSQIYCLPCGPKHGFPHQRGKPVETGEDGYPDHRCAPALPAETPTTNRTRSTPLDQIRPNTSVSHGTMRTQDLLPIFIAAIPDWQRREDYQEQLEDFAFESGDPRADQEGMDDLLDRLFDVLGEYSPEGCYFGAHPGDGADYGWWTSDDVE